MQGEEGRVGEEEVELKDDLGERDEEGFISSLREAPICSSFSTA